MKNIAIVRCNGKEAKLLEIWSIERRAIYLMSRARAARRRAGDLTALPIGFPWEDVFEYDPAVNLDRVDWEKLTPLNAPVLR